MFVRIRSIHVDFSEFKQEGVFAKHSKLNNVKISARRLLVADKLKSLNWLKSSYFERNLLGSTLRDFFKKIIHHFDLATGKYLSISNLLLVCHVMSRKIVSELEPI